MIERMTPSEIADWHDGVVEWDPVAHDYVKPVIYAITAATIRELEASNKARADIIYAQTKASEIDREKLKIATEALERFVEWDDEYDVLPTELERSATQALARIKEV